jgi:hypothetical protein
MPWPLAGVGSRERWPLHNQRIIFARVRLLAKILVLAICLSLPGLGLAKASVLDCCPIFPKGGAVGTQPGGEGSAQAEGHMPNHGQQPMSAANHGHVPAASHGHGPVSAASHDLGQPPDQGEAGTESDPYPLAESCGLASCLKLPAASLFAGAEKAKGPLPLTALVPDTGICVPRDLPESIFRPPRHLTL